MNQYKKGVAKRYVAILAAGIVILASASCGNGKKTKNLLPGDKQKERFVNLFSPMEKIDPDAENVARSASDLTVMMAEEQLGVTVGYMTYTAEDYQDKTYDDVVLGRAIIWMISICLTLIPFWRWEPRVN